MSERVSLPGFVPDIGPWLHRSRVLLLSSHYEGYAAVIIEALAAGRPVVATACTPAAQELLTLPDRGCVVPIGDVPAMTRALRAKLNEAAPDPERLAAAVAHFRIGPISQAYLRIFDDVVSRRPTASGVDARR